MQKARLAGLSFVAELLRDELAASQLFGYGLPIHVIPKCLDVFKKSILIIHVIRAVRLAWREACANSVI